MAIAFVNAADLGASPSGNSFTVSYTAGSGSNRLLLVGVTIDNSLTVTGVTYAGASMTQVTSLNPAGNFNRIYYLFYLLNPTSGANNVIISASGTTSNILGFAADYTGVKQSGQPDNSTTNTNQGNNTALTTSLTSVADNCWGVLFAFDVNTGNTWSAGSGSTERTHDATFNTWAFFDTNISIHPASSFDMTADIATPNPMAAIMASFAPAVAATTVFRRTLSQLGTRVGSRQMVA